MYRRSIIAMVIVAGILMSVPALDLHAAGPGIFRSGAKPRGQATTRTYRSYSVSPGAAEAEENVLVTPDAGAVVRPAPRNPGRPSRSKPSYMRADSKAMGRFGQ